MRRGAASLVMTGLLIFTGCFLGTPPADVVAPSKGLEAAKAVPPITPNAVTEENYRSIPQALWNEMDRAEQQHLFGKSARE